MVLDKLPLCRGCRKDLFVIGWYVVVGPLSGVYKPGLPPLGAGLSGDLVSKDPAFLVCLVPYVVTSGV